MRKATNGGEVRPLDFVVLAVDPRLFVPYWTARVEILREQSSSEKGLSLCRASVDLKAALALGWKGAELGSDLCTEGQPKMTLFIQNYLSSTHHTAAMKVPKTTNSTVSTLP